jgi:hypothetical protein
MQLTTARVKPCFAPPANPGRKREPRGREDFAREQERHGPYLVSEVSVWIRSLRMQQNEVKTTQMLEIKYFERALS